MVNLAFLSQERVKCQEVVELCQKSLKALNNHEEKKIIEALLNDFVLGDWKFLSQQEINFLKLHNKNMWIDYLIYRWKFKNYAKMKKIPKFPIHLLIEPTSICNLRCSMCFQTDKSFSSNKEFMGKMDVNLFTHIIDEAVSGGTKAITFASRGEPTIHPAFGEMLKYCADKFYEIKINTNALVLNEELIHQIFQSKVGIVVFSVDAYDSEGFNKIRNSDKFSQVVGNIKKFHNIRKRYYPDNVVTSRAYGIKVHKNNFDDKQFYSFWKDIADEVVLNSDCETRWDTYNNPKISNRNVCYQALDRMYIWHDGICNPCDVDYKSNLAVGNVTNQSIAEVWNGSKFSKFRKTHIDGNRLTLIPCDRCEL